MIRSLASSILVTTLAVACAAPETSAPDAAPPHVEASRSSATTSSNDFADASTLESPSYSTPSGPGVVETHHADGRLASRGRLNERGERDGLWETWYPSGTPEWRGRYVDGALEGESRTWYDTGARWFVAKSDRGRARSMDVWHANGRRAMERLWTESPLAMDEARWWDTGEAMSVGRMLPSEPSGTQCTERSGLWLEWTEDGGLHPHEAGLYRDGWKVRELEPEEVAEAEAVRVRLEEALRTERRYFLKRAE